jgi:hypothetical protein
VLDAEWHIDHWARWCLDQAGIRPDCATNWDVMPEFLYKNSHLTAEEKLEEAKRQRPIEVAVAERVELWVRQFDLLPQTVLRVHYVKMPESRQNVPDAMWLAWRAGEVQRILRERGEPQRVDADVYHAGLGEGLCLISECLTMWARGV